jgi:BirA family biotin operon repressor/biotin-[acetyl-CoA-carboxylase] ligase
MRGAAPVTGWPPGLGRIVLDETDSTMAEAARRVATLDGPVWILARRQTAGRGRAGRPWTDPPGNFAATLVLFPDDPPARLALRSFTASLAVAATVAALTGAEARLKWPNDVLLMGAPGDAGAPAKLAGILLESGGAGRPHLFIGIGVNLAAAPQAPPDRPEALPATSLAAATGVTVDPETFLDALAPRFAAWEATLAKDGFAPIREAWLALAYGLGQPIRARIGAATRHGRFEGIDAAGALRLATPGGVVHVAAGDVHFLA